MYYFSKLLCLKTLIQLNWISFFQVDRSWQKYMYIYLYISYVSINKVPAHALMDMAN